MPTFILFCKKIQQKIIGNQINRIDTVIKIIPDNKCGKVRYLAVETRTVYFFIKFISRFFVMTHSLGATDTCP